MALRLEGSFEVKSWDEDQATGLEEAPRVSIARIEQQFSGGLEADTVTDTVMTSHDDGTAEFLGLQRVVGSIGEKSGSFVLRSIGRYDGKEARSELTVLPGSTKGDFVGLTGTGVSCAPQGSTGTYTFVFAL